MTQNNEQELERMDKELEVLFNQALGAISDFLRGKKTEEALDVQLDKLNGEAKEKMRAALKATEERVRGETVERCQTLVEESEWECPLHGKEFRITPPLCKECNQCLEVNVILADVYKGIGSLTKNTNL